MATVSDAAAPAPAQNPILGRLGDRLLGVLGLLVMVLALAALAALIFDVLPPPRKPSSSKLASNTFPATGK